MPKVEPLKLEKNSILDFLLYFMVNDFIQIWLSIQLAVIIVYSRIFSAPIGTLIAEKLDEKIARKTVAVLSISLGLFTLIRILLL